MEPWPGTPARYRERTGRATDACGHLQALVLHCLSSRAMQRIALLPHALPHAGLHRRETPPATGGDIPCSPCLRRAARGRGPVALPSAPTPDPRPVLLVRAHRRDDGLSRGRAVRGQRSVAVAGVVSLRPPGDKPGAGDRDRWLRRAGCGIVEFGTGTGDRDARGPDPCRDRIAGNWQEIFSLRSVAPRTVITYNPTTLPACGREPARTLLFAGRSAAA